MRIPCEPLNMKISVMNKNTAVRKSFSETSGSKVIISIRTPGDEKAEFDDENKSIKDVLYLAFYDVSFENSDIYAGYAGMTAEDAQKVKEFVLKWKDEVRELWIHCDAGASRSAGIAAGILKAFGKDDSELFKTLLPNSLCYRRTLCAFLDQN